ncbi:MAG: citryl-CoA lyase, partial [Actinomycetota bacterium]
MSDDWVRSSIGRATPDAIIVRGRNVADELMGKMSFADLAFLLAAGREPTTEESELFSAILISLADHGLTPTVLAARLTYTGAPEAMQGAIAAGLLGGGSVFLGPVSDTAAFLGRIVDGLGDSPSDGSLQAAAKEAVDAEIAASRRIPGRGHPIHRVGDPRTPRLYEL